VLTVPQWPRGYSVPARTWESGIQGIRVSTALPYLDCRVWGSGQGQVSSAVATSPSPAGAQAGPPKNK